MKNSCARVCILLLLSLFWANFVHARPKIYGNYQLNFQRQKQPLATNNLYNQTLYFNLSDYVMVKNRFLFTAYLTRNEYVSNSKRVDFRPRLDFDLSGTPYKLFFSYLPYNLPSVGGVKVYYKQYQSLASLSPGGYPSLRFNWNRTDQHDNLTVRKSDVSFRSWSIGSSWNKTKFNASILFTQQENVDRALREKTLFNRSFITGAGLNLNVPGSGFFASNYNYSRNMRDQRGVRTSTLNTHALTALYSTPLGKKFSFNSNYSGRFSFNQQLSQNQKFQDQTLNNSVTFTPLNKMELSLLRADVKTLAPATQISQDYWAGIFNYFFPVWRSMEGKFSYSKTYFVQSTQGQYTPDVYYFSLGSQVYQSLQIRADLSVNYRSGDLFALTRYQTSRYFDLRSQPWEKLQFNYYYQSNLASPELILNQILTESHNFYLSYFPSPGWSTTLNYLERYSALGLVQKQRVYSGQVYHSFRGQYSLGVNYSQTKASQFLANNDLRSDLLSAQLTLFLERRTVLALSYTASNLTKGDFTSTLGATLNQQF